MTNTPITTEMTTESMVKRLADNGFRTLEDCARAGNSELLKVKSVSSATLSRLRRECRRRKIDWAKSMSEKSFLTALKEGLLETYGISEKEAELCCEIYFTEGWGVQ